MSNGYKILEEGTDNKVLVEWERGSDFYFRDGKEYSVHTVSLQGNLIWGHYFREEENAKEYFKQYKKSYTDDINDSDMDMVDNECLRCGTKIKVCEIYCKHCMDDIIIENEIEEGTCR